MPFHKFLKYFLIFNNINKNKLNNPFFYMHPNDHISTLES
jgi:hypothetical protein